MCDCGIHDIHLNVLFSLYYRFIFMKRKVKTLINRYKSYEHFFFVLIYVKLH